MLGKPLKRTNWQDIKTAFLIAVVFAGLYQLVNVFAFILFVPVYTALVYGLLLLLRINPVDHYLQIYRKYEYRE